MLELSTIILLIISSLLFFLLLQKSKQINKLTSTCKEYDTLLNAVNIPIFYKDKDGKFIGFNKSFDISFGSHKNDAIKELQHFRTSQTKEINLIYDNAITKSTIIHFTNYLDGSVGLLFDTSKMKNNKTKLLEQKNRLEYALKGSDEGIWEWDIKTNALILSKKAQDILGYKEGDKTPESMVDWMNLVDSYDISKTNESLASHIDGRTSNIDVDHRLRISETITWINLRGKGTLGKDNKISKVYGTIRDISKEKKEFFNISKEKDLFTTFMDNLPALAFIKSKEGRYIYINNYYQKLLGFKTWKNKTVEEIFEKQISDPIIESDRESFYEGKHKHEEYVINEEGIKKLFETYKFPVDNNTEKVLCGFGLDITKEKQYQEKIKLYAKVFNTANEGIIITNHKNEIISVNDSFRTITGYSEKEVLGKNPNIRKSNKNTKELYVQMWKSLLSKGVWSGEIFNKNKDGTILPELMNINVIKNEKNEIINFVGIFQSIEKQKIVELKLKKMAHYDVLTNLPNRTLFSDRLDQAMQRATRDNQMLGLVFVDLDNFKIINDTKGHAAGDLVLKEASKRLTLVIRDTDTVARLGGDEFVIILEKISQISDISYIANKVISEIKKPIKINDQNEECFIGASLGISIYPNQTKDKKELIEYADNAMYKAKEDGKNCYKIYEN